MSIDVKITPGGQVMFSWPEEWMEVITFAVPTLTPHSNIVEQVKLDMGYIIHGAGINKGTVNYKGTFDGERLFAKSNFIGKRIQAGTFGPFISDEAKGPIRVEWFIDLTVVPVPG